MTEPAAENELLTKGPEWLTTRRLDAWRQSIRLPFPTGREEAWRYTDVSQLRAELYSDPDTQTPNSLQAAQSYWQQLDSGRSHALFVNGEPHLQPFGDWADLDGVTVLELNRAAAERPGLLRGRLGSLVGADDPFTARSLALHRGGLLVHVPEGVSLDAPLQILHWLDAPGALVYPRIVLVVERGARIRIEEHHAGQQLVRPALTQPVVEIFAGEQSRITWQSWQRYGPGTRHLSNLVARLESRAHLTTFHATFGADFSRTNVATRLAGPGAESDLLGVYFPTREQHLEHWTVQDHQAPDTRSNLLYKGALADAAHSVFYGRIAIGAAGAGADSFQTNRHLLLSPAARADSNPQLEIDTNDVRCSHGSSVGQVDADQLFYAMSRGIPRAEAERLLVTGFLGEVADRLDSEAATARLERLIRDTLDQTVVQTPEEST